MTDADRIVDAAMREERRQAREADPQWQAAQARYAEQKARFDAAYAAWKAGGEQGPPPPRPVPPHVPGWLP